ncbi:MAG: hypothetical protein WKF84_20810 [Pyrinomonadaceae bacterium]
MSQAVAMAGGLLPDANSEKIRVLRQEPGATQKTEIIANLKMINRRKAEDIFLRANDIVEVAGPSGSKKILNTVMRTPSARADSISPLGDQISPLLNSGIVLELITVAEAEQLK